MESIPKVTVITRTKDRPVFLERAITSVLSQSFEDWVHVIVNDGGDPKAVDLLVLAHEKRYQGRVKVVHHEESQGMQNASNAGLESTDSTYAVIHDDDDSWYADFLEKTVEFLEEEGADSLIQGVVCQTTQVFEEICIAGNILEIKTIPYYPFDFVNMEEMRQRNLFAPIAFLYRRAAHQKAGLFRQEFDVLGDHDFNLRFLRHFEIGVIPTFHAYYHWRHGSQGNTVTRARGLHRQMLSRLKNTYYREALETPKEAVGSLDEITFPKRDGVDPVPFKLRKEEPKPLQAMPDFKKEYDFEVLSLDVFDTVLKRRCHHPKDVFRFLEARAVEACGLKEKPYALAREQAESLAREEMRPDISREVTLDEIYTFVAKLCDLTAKEAKVLQQLELKIEKELLYGDPRWLKLYADYKAAGRRVVFVSDMYLSADILCELMEGCGFADPEVYVSCDYKASKHEGTLQGKIQSHLKVAPEKILHVGDNFHSDFLKSIHSGWQAFHWSQAFNYTPWFAQVDPYIHNRDDLLSSRIMGEAERMGLIQGKKRETLVETLGREVAGPIYLAYLLWVVKEAKRTGVRKLLLIGRDGYYWEKTLRELAKKAPLGIEFSYLHASRKVFNFASFETLDATALEFLKTPNPALRVRDFIDRTGLDSGKFLHFIKMAGFSDPDEVVTNEMGGRFLQKHFSAQLDNLFKLLKLDLESIFAEDRAGTLKVLEDSGFNPVDCAFVDIGWNGSCVRPVARMLNLPEAQKVTCYFFGTWKEALKGKGASRVRFKSFFLHFSKPDEHIQLIRESVNLIEALHAAPFPTLLAFNMEGDQVAPVYADHLKGGFSEKQQAQLWKGAEAFLKAATEKELPKSGNMDGHCYINLVLNRFLREPSPKEVKTWGSILHSDGFGLEVYKPLIEAVDDDLGGEQLLRAYRGSNWKCGFLSSLPAPKRDYILERIQPMSAKSRITLEADLEWKTRQADELWEEKERYKWESNHFKEEVARLTGEKEQLLWETDHLKGELSTHQSTIAELQRKADKLEGDLGFKEQQAEELWKEKGQLQWEADHFKEQLSSHQSTIVELQSKIDQLTGELGFKEKQAEGLWSDKEQLNWEIGNLKEQVTSQLSTVGNLEEEISSQQSTIGNLQSEIDKREGDLNFKTQQADELWAKKEQLAWRVGNIGERLQELQSELDAALAREAYLSGILHKRGKVLKVLLSGKIPHKPDSDKTD